ncbi:MAG: cation:proton antiporter [Actinomycetia bacterium]|nr:cation:proton antiporter [Actinomycetes bacterium]
MDSTIYALVGAGFLLAALLPSLTRNLPVSLPLAFLGLGLVLFWLPLSLPVPDVDRDRRWIEHIAEITVILSLAGVGLSLNRRPGLHRWGSTWRLLAVAMPLTIVGVAAVGLWAGLGTASALLLGAVLAPTDPVLASDVQVDGPDGGSEDEVRFALTSEAGLNDALAFPFVWLAILVADHGLDPREWLVEWLVVEVLWKIGAGLIVGLIVGRAFGWLAFRVPHRRIRLAEQSDGFVILAATFLAYGIAELAHAYGFLAVFVAALTHRRHETDAEYHVELVAFGEQIERLLIVLVLVMLGGLIANGALAPLTFVDVLLVLALLLVVRPGAALLALLGGRTRRSERFVIAVFGVRGVGSIYYLAFGLGAASFADSDRLWAIVLLSITMSVVVFGLLATPTLAWLEALDVRRGRNRALGGRPQM